MAGVPDYSKHANEIEEEVVKVKPDLKSVRNKFREKEPMTAEKFGIYLGGCSIPIKEISEKTIKRYISLAFFKCVKEVIDSRFATAQLSCNLCTGHVQGIAFDNDVFVIKHTIILLHNVFTARQQLLPL